MISTRRAVPATASRLSATVVLGGAARHAGDTTCDRPDAAIPANVTRVCTRLCGDDALVPPSPTVVGARFGLDGGRVTLIAWTCAVPPPVARCAAIADRLARHRSSGVGGRMSSHVDSYLPRSCRMPSGRPKNHRCRCSEPSPHLACRTRAMLPNDM